MGGFHVSFQGCCFLFCFLAPPCNFFPGKKKKRTPARCLSFACATKFRLLIAIPPHPKHVVSHSCPRYPWTSSSKPRTNLKNLKPKRWSQNCSGSYWETWTSTTHARGAWKTSPTTASKMLIRGYIHGPCCSSIQPSISIS